MASLNLDEDTAVLLIAMSAAAIDRRLAPARSTLVLKGRSHTKPGSLLKSRIPMRTWADHDKNTPEFVEIDLVGHEGGNSRGVPPGADAASSPEIDGDTRLRLTYIRKCECLFANIAESGALT